MTLKIAQMNRPTSAVATALTLLAKQPPFDRYPLAQMVGTVTGAVSRGHYVFVMEGERFVGFGCWALTTETEVQAWVENRADASAYSGRDGDIVALMIAVGEHPKAPSIAFRHAARLYPGQRYVFRRTSRGARLVWGRFPEAPAGSTSEDEVVEA